MLLATTQARLMAAQARTMDMEWQQQLISQALMQMSNTIGALTSLTADLEPESPSYQSLMSRLNGIQTIEKSLNLQKQRIDIQYKNIEKERESLKSLVDKGAENFKYLS
jgi:allophanate hydrolase subunit 1